jgi:hypothetical protein
VVVQEVRWVKEGTEQAEEYTFFYRKGNKNNQLWQELFVHNRIISAIMRIEFVSDRMPHVVLRGRWRNIIALNVHAPPERQT